MAAGQGDLQSPASVALTADVAQIDGRQPANERAILLIAYRRRMSVDSQRGQSSRVARRSPARTGHQSRGLVQPVDAHNLDAGNEPRLIEVLPRHGDTPVSRTS